MAEKTNKRDLAPTIGAFKKWSDICLIRDGSILGEGELWTSQLISEVRRAFVDHPDEGKDDFMTKLRGQMKDASPGAKQLAAEMLWALSLFPSNIKQDTKRQAMDR